jgi:hypothetical protein
MGKPTITFSKLVDKLQRHYGCPAPPPSTDPLELIIWENIAYLASDKRRAEALASLQQTIGTHPKEILAAQHSALAAIGKAGKLPDISAEKLLTIAKIAYEEFDSDLRAAIKKPLPQAKKALKRFPGIGDPGAEKHGDSKSSTYSLDTAKPLAPGMALCLSGGGYRAVMRCATLQSENTLILQFWSALSRIREVYELQARVELSRFTVDCPNPPIGRSVESEFG